MFRLTLELVPGFMLSWNEVGEMKSGDLARIAKVSTDTLRHYERLKLLPPPQRTAANYRRYPACAVARVRLIQQALAIRFSLTDLQSILGDRDSGSFPCRRVRRFLDAKIQDVSREREGLAVFQKQLTRLTRDWDQRLARASRTKPVFLLEQTPSSIRDPRRHLRKRAIKER
jgi:MerR family transcriptional regulator, copper efflux regulator